MSDKDLIERLAKLNLEDAELTEFEEGFLSTMGEKWARCDLFLSEKQRKCAEDILEKCERHGEAETILRPPPGKEKYFRQRKPWED